MGCLSTSLLVEKKKNQEKEKSKDFKLFPLLNWKMIVGPNEEKKMNTPPSSEPSGQLMHLRVQSQVAYTSFCPSLFWISKKKILGPVIIFHHYTRHIKYKRTFPSLHFSTLEQQNQSPEVIWGQEVRAVSWNAWATIFVISRGHHPPHLGGHQSPLC